MLLQTLHVSPQDCPRFEAHSKLSSALLQNTGHFVSEDVIPLLTHVAAASKSNILLLA